MGKNEPLKDDPGGYGGGRERVEETAEGAFGEQGWGGGRAAKGKTQSDGVSKDLPEGVEDVGPDDPKWQERYAAENHDKYGQAGGKPVVQRGAAQSGGGEDQKEQGLGDTQDVSSRGAYGAKETEKWPAHKKNQ